jgi:nicotinamidase-related amidase
MTASQLLVIDVQNGFINEWTRHVPLRVGSLQDTFDHVLVSRFYAPQKSLHRRLVGGDGFALGSVDTQLAFTPVQSALIIDTPLYSCISESILNVMRSRGIARVHLCGIATDKAVLKCALDLFDGGLEPVVLAHATGSDAGPALHEAGLQILRRTIGERQVIGS